MQRGLMMENHRSRKLKTRPVSVAGFVGVAVMLIGAVPAQAEICAQYRNGSTNCYFTTQRQCAEAISGVGGFCTQIGGSAATPTAEPAARHAKTSAEPKRKHEAKRATPAVAAAPAAAPPSAP